MNLSGIDWAVVATFLAIIIGMAFYTRRYSTSVADFLAANRCAGRYLIVTGDAASYIGAISVMAYFQMYYVAGFTAIWWFMMTLFVANIIALTGWQIYRFRETKAMTLAQFLEIRYSKKFRMFAGTVGFISGILNFGIFPAVSARFIVYFCGIPEHVGMLGLSVPSIVLVMAVLIIIALVFTFVGGQITVIVVDFLSGTFMYGVFILVIIAVMFVLFRWDRLMEGISYVPQNTSMVNPFKASGGRNFNMFYFIIMVFNNFMNFMAWQGNSGYKCAAKSPHEAKMAGILGTWRQVAYYTAIILLAIAAFTIMHHPAYSEIAQKVSTSMNVISDNTPTGQIKSQLLVPMAILHILPKGMIGLFCALMVAAVICTHMTYMHSWGTIFIQDIVLPARGKPFTTRQHITLLRLSILCVAVFVFVFGILYRQTDDIFMYFAITASIFLGGVGSVIVGGLYWKRGTTAAAFSAMLVGIILSVTAMIIENIWPYYHNGDKFPITSQVTLFIAICSSIATYITVSLLGPKNVYNMDKMLHRGIYASEEDKKAQLATGLKAFVLGGEATRSDKLIYVLCLGWGLFWLAVFSVGCIYNMFHHIEDSSWMWFWKQWVYVNLVAGACVWIWFAIGGFKNLKELFHTLRTTKRDSHDDGLVLSQEKTTQSCSSATKSQDLKK